MWDIGVGYSPHPWGRRLRLSLLSNDRCCRELLRCHRWWECSTTLPCRSLHIPIPVPFRSVGLPQDFGISLGPSALMRIWWFIASATDRWTVEVSRQIDDILTPLEVSYVNASSRWLGRTHAVVFTPAFEVTPVSITSVYPVLIASSNGQPH